MAKVSVCLTGYPTHPHLGRLRTRTGLDLFLGKHRCDPHPAGGSGEEWDPDRPVSTDRESSRTTEGPPSVRFWGTSFQLGGVTFDGPGGVRRERHHPRDTGLDDRGPYLHRRTQDGLSDREYLSPLIRELVSGSGKRRVGTGRVVSATRVGDPRTTPTPTTSASKGGVHLEFKGPPHQLRALVYASLQSLSPLRTSLTLLPRTVSARTTSPATR